MTNPGIYGGTRGGGGAIQPTPKRQLDLVADYGVTTSAGSAASNTAAIQKAFSDAAYLSASGVPPVVYLPGSGFPYPVTTLTLPSEPITFIGDGPTTSTLSTTQGTILTYASSTNDLYGSNDPWSQNSTWLGGSAAAVHYRSKYWMLTGLGFTKTDNWTGNTGTGLDFSTNWSLSGLSYGVMMYMQDCLITNFNGPGINYLINGLRGESKFLRVMVDGCKNEGVIYGSDQMWVNCCSNNNGYEGFWADGRNGQLIACKAYSNGVLNGTTRNAGFYYQNNSGGSLLIGCYAQDNHGPGFYLHNASRVAISGFVSDRNCQNNNTVDTAAQASAVLEDCTDVTVDGLAATDSNTSGYSTFGTCTITAASPFVVNATGSSLSAGNGVFFTTTGVLPAPLQVGVEYFVISTGLGANSFQVSATVGGSALNATTIYQSGTHTLITQSGRNNVQRYALRVNNTGGTTCLRNRVRLVMSTSVRPLGAVLTPVDPSSNLNGTGVTVDDGVLAQQDTTPASVQNIYPGMSVVVNRKYSLGASPSGVNLSSGAILRIL